MDTLREIIAANPNGISRAGMLAWAQLRIDPGYDEARLDSELAALGDEVDASAGFYRLRGSESTWESPEPAVDDGTAEAQSAVSPAAAGGIAGWAPPQGSVPLGGASPEASDATWPAETTASATAGPGAAASPAAAPPMGEGVAGWIGPDGTLATEAPSRGGIGGLIRRFWILGVIALIALGAFVFRDRITGSASDLAVGDCFDLPSQEVAEIEDVQHHPCDEAHTAEVFLVYEYAGATDTYPTEDEFGASVSENCVPAFAGYTGSDFEQQQSLDIYWLFPVADGWEGGDHELVCSLFRVDEQPLTKSMKGANPS